MYLLTETIIEILDKSYNEILTIHNEPIVGVINGLYATTNGDGGIIPIQIYNNVIQEVTHNNQEFDIKISEKQNLFKQLILIIKK